MEREILDILDKYENIDVNFYFVKDILKVLRKHYHVEDYLKRLIIYSNEKTKVGGSFYTEKKAIFINLSFYNFIKDIELKKLLILFNIFHELEHTVQIKIFDDGDSNDIYLNSFLSIGFEGYNCKNFDTYRDHDLITVERLANIRSMNKIIKVLSLNYEKYKKIIILLKFYLYNYIIDNYDVDDNKIVCPLDKYINKLYGDKEKSYIDYFMVEDKINKMTLNKRVLYGLPISEGEFNLISSTQIKVLKLLPSRYKKYI